MLLQVNGLQAKHKEQADDRRSEDNLRDPQYSFTRGGKRHEQSDEDDGEEAEEEEEEEDDEGISF